MATETYDRVDAGFLEGFRHIRRPNDNRLLSESQRQQQQQHEARVAAAAELFSDLYAGRIRSYMLQEVLAPSRPEMARLIESNYPGVLRRSAPWESPSVGLLLQEEQTTSDFPLLVGDVLDRMLLARFAETPMVWEQYIARGAPLTDFRATRLLRMDGGDDRWAAIPEGGGITYEVMSETGNTITPDLYGKGMKVSWRLLRNDNLGAFRDIPGVLARGGRRTISYFATDLLFDSNGPDATFVSAGNGNLLASNPVFNITNLGNALETLASFTDSEGEPIAVEAPRLVHGPGLMVEVKNVLNQLMVDMTIQGGATNQTMRVNNWIASGLVGVLDPYIPIVATTNGATSWMLIANPANGRPAAMMRFLSGFETPQMFQKQPNTLRAGGGVDNALGDFDSMATEYKGLVAFGGTTIEAKSCVGSNGSGA